MTGRVRVKICGFTNREDAETAIALGADALGFNFYTGSKRHLSFDENFAWIGALPTFVTTVAVLVNAPLPEAARIALHPAINIVQLHGDEDASYCRDFSMLKRPFVKALRIRDEADIAKVTMKDVLREMLPYYVPLIVTLLLITYVPALTTWIPRLALGP